VSNSEQQEVLSSFLTTGCGEPDYSAGKDIE
jgi:hypothetical protein